MSRCYKNRIVKLHISTSRQVYILKFISQVQQHLSTVYRHNLLVINSSIPLSCLFSAVWNGGIHTATDFITTAFPFISRLRNFSLVMVLLSQEQLLMQL